jgi:hypothetical protein
LFIVYCLLCILSIVYCIYCLLSILFIVYCLYCLLSILSIVHCLYCLLSILSIVYIVYCLYCLLSIVYCLLSIVYIVYCLLSIVYIVYIVYCLSILLELHVCCSCFKVFYFFFGIKLKTKHLILGHVIVHIFNLPIKDETCLGIVVSNTYCVMFLFRFSSSCAPYVASLFGLSFFNCPFGIL